jgi:hypothetical protein
MNYRIVEQIGSEWRITETDDIAKWANERGLSWRTNFNTRHRQELQGQPIFNGYAGPSWDGEAIRYENSQAHNVLKMKHEGGDDRQLSFYSLIPIRWRTARRPPQ